MVRAIKARHIPCIIIYISTFIFIFMYIFGHAYSAVRESRLPFRPSLLVALEPFPICRHGKESERNPLKGLSPWPNPHDHSWGVGARLQLHCWHESLARRSIRCNPFSSCLFQKPGGKQPGWTSEKLLLLDFVGDCGLFESTPVRVFGRSSEISEHVWCPWTNMTNPDRVWRFRVHFTAFALSPVYFLPLRILRTAGISAHVVEHWHGTAWKDGRSLLLCLAPCDRTDFWQNQLAVGSRFWIGSPWMQFDQVATPDFENSASSWQRNQQVRGPCRDVLGSAH